MAAVSPIPQGVHTVTPNLIFHDCAEAIEFYEKALATRTKRRSVPWMAAIALRWI